MRSSRTEWEILNEDLRTAEHKEEYARITDEDNDLELLDELRQALVHVRSAQGR